MYDHRYKAVVDGVETDSVMEIDPSHRVVTFQMGNGSKEVLEVHDFKNASKRRAVSLSVFIPTFPGKKGGGWKWKRRFGACESATAAEGKRAQH